MWKCPTCDTNNESDQFCCAVCGMLQSEALAQKITSEPSGAQEQNPAYSEQKQQTNQYAAQAEKPDDLARVIDPAGSPGVDLRYNLTISLEESVFGSEREISFVHEARCSVCGGNGAVTGTGMAVCAKCNGTGQDRASRRFFSKQADQPTALCAACHGSGKVPVAKCSVCGGLGRRSAHEKKTIAVPRGINEGQALLLKGLGNVSYNDGPNGDLYVSIRIEPHKKFTRNGYDLHADMPVPASVAASGGEVVFETLRDAVKFRIPKGTQDGDLLRLQQQGVPHLDSSEVGDLLLKIRVV